MSTLVDYIQKANENIIAVLQVGGAVPYPGINLKLMREQILTQIGEDGAALISNNEFGGQGERIVELLKEILSQNPRTSYDSDLVQNNSEEIKAIVEG